MKAFGWVGLAVLAAVTAFVAYGLLVFVGR